MNDRTKRVREKLKKLVEQSCGKTIQSRFDYSDVVQEGMIQLFTADANNKICDDTAWLSKIGTVHFCKLHRHNLAKKRSVNAEEVCVPGAIKARGSHQLEHASIELLSCLDEIDIESRHTIVRRFYDGASYKTIAEELNTSPYGAKTICEQALSFLRERLSERGVDSDRA